MKRGDYVQIKETFSLVLKKGTIWKFQTVSGDQIVLFDESTNRTTFLPKSESELYLKKLEDINS